MLKRDELADPKSCLNKAADDEFVFVLRGHDVATPGTILAWVAERLRLEKNRPNDPQIHEAIAAANALFKKHCDRRIKLLNALPELVAACEAAIRYDDAPILVAGLGLSRGDDLDTLYMEWITKAKSAINNINTITQTT